MDKRCQYTLTISRLHAAEEGQADDKNIDHENQYDETTTTTSPLRRSVLAGTVATFLTPLVTSPSLAAATITKDSEWKLWPALPVAPYSRRKTMRQDLGNGVWIFDQLIGIYYVHVPIRMTVIAINQQQKQDRGLLVYAPIAPTKECLTLLQELIDEYGPIKYIILPSVAVEHKVNAGPFARQFPDAEFYAVAKQYSFPIPLPNEFLGLPPWTKPLTERSSNSLFGDEIDFEVLTVKPGPGSMYQDVALVHKPSKTLVVCDAIFGVTNEPPDILTMEPEYTRALLFHARDEKDEIPPDTPENRRKGWRRIVLLFNFFFPGSGMGDLSLRPVIEALKTPKYEFGWGGWMPFTWRADAEGKDFDTYSDNGKPCIYPVVQIILARDPKAVENWVDTVTQWKFDRVIPAHINAPLKISPAEFAEPFQFVRDGRNEVRFCDEDVAFLRAAEEGVLNFSVYKTPLGVLRGRNGPCGL